MSTDIPAPCVRDILAQAAGGMQPIRRCTSDCGWNPVAQTLGQAVSPRDVKVLQSKVGVMPPCARQAKTH